MPKISNAADLKYAIRQLEHNRDKELILLKKQLHATTESFKLANIVKGKLKGIISSPGLTSILMNAGIGLTTGFITRKLFAGRTTLNPVKSMMKTIIENTLLKNGAGINILSSFLSRKTDRKSNPR